MLIDKKLIIEAKEKLGEKSARLINEYFKLQNWDEKNLKGTCPFGTHTDSTPSFIWNPKESCFHCFSCGRNFGIIDLYMEQDGKTYLGAVEKLFSEVGMTYRFGEKGVKVDRDYRYPKYVYNEDRSVVEEYLSFRKISKETLDFADVQQDSHGNIVFHYYDLNDVLCVVKYRVARVFDTKKEKVPKFWSQKDTDTMPILYGINQIDPTEKLLIVEGELDRLAVIEAGFRNVVSVPNGATSFGWIEKCWDFLEQFEKIIIWSDNDSAGLTLRKEACTRLGTWKTFFVDLPKEAIKEDGEIVKVKDANDILFNFGGQAVLDYIKTAQETPVQGVVDLSTVPDFDLEKATGLYTGIKVINNIIYKFLFGSVILLTGQKGSGKSSFLNQAFVCESLDQGHDVFIFSGELGNPVLKSWIEIAMAGHENITMKNDFVHVIKAEAKAKIKEWYQNRLWVYDDNTNNSDAILDKAISVTRRYGVKTWILDNLMTLDIGAGDANLWQKQKDFIVKLVGLAKLYNVLVVLVSHPRKTMVGEPLTSDDISGSNDLGNLAQYIVSVHRYTTKEREGTKNGKGGYKVGYEPVKYDACVTVLKNRYTGKLGKADLYFNYPDYRFYNTTEELFKRYHWDDGNENPVPTIDPNSHENVPESMRD
jgi:5S rRNA maturation endonuclease (ribonuclease M5)/archaellum biogenesis ATPase FlaH